jgi:hypothetical protein
MSKAYWATAGDTKSKPGGIDPSKLLKSKNSYISSKRNRSILAEKWRQIENS